MTNAVLLVKIEQLRREIEAAGLDWHTAEQVLREANRKEADRILKEYRERANANANA